MNALLIIPILTFLIFVHELGHFYFARRAGVKVEEFGIGLPPRLWGIQRGETLWSINWIPLGGFVRVLGEDGKNFDERSMQSKPAGARALFLAAGSGMNFLAAFVLIGVLIVSHGVASSSVYITETVAEAPAAEAGLQPGDRIVSAEGNDIDTTGDLVSVTQDHLGEQMTLVVERDGERVSTTLVPREQYPAGQGPTGVAISDGVLANVTFRDVPADSVAAEMGFQEDDVVKQVGDTEITDIVTWDLGLNQNAGQTVDVVVQRDGDDVTFPVTIPETISETGSSLGADVAGMVKFQRPPLIEIVPLTFEQFFEFISRMFDGLMMILRGDVSLDEIAGPIGMGQLTSEVVEQATVPYWAAILNITIILSLNLAILNLLPLPALDGGRLMFVGIEVLRRGKRVAPEKEGLVHLVGFVVLLTFMVAVAFIDIDRLISGDSFLQ